MRVIRASQTGPSWALAIVVIVASLCREGLSMENIIKPLTDLKISDSTILPDATLSKEASTFKPQTEASTSDALMKEDPQVLIREKTQPKRLDKAEAIEIDEPPSPEQLIMGVRDAVLKNLEKDPARGASNAALLQALSQAKDPQALAEVVASDFKAMTKLAGVFGDLMQDRRHVMIMDDEADDLWLLLIMATKNILPAQVLTHGGHPYLRAHCVEYYIQQLALAFKIPPNEIPTVHMGPPYLGEGATQYPDIEGTGYVEEELRQELISKSFKLKTEWKAMEKPWLHPEFASALDVMRKMLDDPKSTDNAFVVTTAPNLLVNVIDENPERAQRMIVTMSSPYFFQVDYARKSVRWQPAFNAKGSATLPAMNTLLESGVRFLGVGGGVSVSKGMRQISDAAHGKEGSQLMSDYGLVGLEKIINKKSEAKFAATLAWASENITKHKVVEWRQQLKELDDWVAAGRPQGAREPKLARTNKESLTNMREMAGRFGNPVQIETAAADLYVVGIMRDEIAKTLQGALSYGFRPTKSRPGPDGKIRPALDTFVPSEAQVHLAVTDFNALAMRDGVQQALDHVGQMTGTFTAEDKLVELDRIAGLKAKAGRVNSELNSKLD
ncbi:hypothetical protein DFH28DRAFT_238449 [Melampsora americana]|nr:hypothetical protein DFH28DRAFT_238449 [Melampsora americana]